MSFNVNLAGHIRDQAGESIEIPNHIDDSEKLLNYLSEKYPTSAKYKMQISVDGILVGHKTKFTQNSRIFLFNPIAGG